MLSSAPAALVSRGRAKGPRDDFAHSRKPRRSGLLAPVAQSRSRPSEGAEHVTWLMAKKRGAGVLINDRARVMVTDVLHESLGTLEVPARAFAPPVRAIMERCEGQAREWRSGA